MYQSAATAEFGVSAAAPPFTTIRISNYVPGKSLSANIYRFYDYGLAESFGCALISGHLHVKPSVFAHVTSFL
jgi:hypothetical protein